MSWWNGSAEETKMTTSQSSDRVDTANNESYISLPGGIEDENIQETKHGRAASIRTVAFWVSGQPCNLLPPTTHLAFSLFEFSSLNSVIFFLLQVCTAIVFGVGLGFKEGAGKASEFFAGYVYDLDLCKYICSCYILVWFEQNLWWYQHDCYLSSCNYSDVI